MPFSLQIVSTSADDNLGGRDLDLLAEHIMEDFKTHYNVDVHSKWNAFVRFLTGYEKLKKLMLPHAAHLSEYRMLHGG